MKTTGLNEQAETQEEVQQNPKHLCQEQPV